MMRGGDKKGMDWSGHVTMTHQQLEFYKEFEHKGLMTETLRNHGLLVQKPTRNPLRAEKTPRKMQPGELFDFSIPQVNQGEERVKEKLKKDGGNRQWEYPENDWGLMSKFRSQTKIYENIRKMQDTYAEKLEAFQQHQLESKNKEASQNINSNNNNNSQTSREPQLSARSSARGSAEPLQSGRMSTSRSYLSESGGGVGGTARSSSRLALDTIQESAPRQSARLEDFNISSLKSLSSTNPEILEKLRASRAAKYVSSLPFNPLEAPKVGDPPNTKAVFKPGGGSVDLTKASTKEKGSRSPAKEDTLTQLMAQLNETNEAIDTQKLKLGLNSKARRY